MSSNKTAYDFKTSLSLNGYTFCSDIRTTLQGQIIKVKESCNNNTQTPTDDNVVIKMANKELCNKRVGVINDKQYRVDEDILCERDILKHLTNKNGPGNMTNFIGYFDDSQTHFLVMEYGGNCLLDFVHKFHNNYISNGYYSIKSWKEKCKQLFEPIVHFTDWLHNTMNICHLDISLENLLISNVNISFDERTNQIIFPDDCVIKFCDFGLAQSFSDASNFQSEKYVGKKKYKAPKVYAKKGKFDARLADVWSLGVVLFTMSIGKMPFKTPNEEDNAFNLIFNGQLNQILIKLNRVNYVTPQLYRLLWNIFKPEEKRITIKEILQHEYFTQEYEEDSESDFSE